MDMIPPVMIVLPTSLVLRAAARRQQRQRAHLYPSTMGLPTTKSLRIRVIRVIRGSLSSPITNHTNHTNPGPNVVVEPLDYAYALAESAPFLIALTVE
jgi:hypothetical protein